MECGLSENQDILGKGVMFHEKLYNSNISSLIVSE